MATTDLGQSLKFNWHQLLLGKTVVLFLFGFSAGLPIILIFGTLSLWLGEAGVQKSAVTYFSWAALGYSFKFVWAPIVDKLPLPILSRWLGRRRGWLLLSQLAIVAAIVWMASTDPTLGLTTMAFAAVALGFSSATQDIVIDAYRIECAERREQALLSSTYIAGYRIGMAVSGAGALYIADMLGTSKELYLYEAWQKTYWAMAAVMGVGIMTTLFIKEPNRGNYKQSYSYETSSYCRFFILFLLSVTTLVIVFRLFPAIDWDLEGYTLKIARFGTGTLQMILAVSAAIVVGIIGAQLGIADKAMVRDSYLSPIQDFFKRYGKLTIWVLLLIGFYRVSDIVMGVIANVFYQDMGYTKTQIGSVTKLFGIIMTITGSFLGGFLSLKIGVIRVLLIGAIFAAITNLLFAWLASSNEPTLQALTLVIAADNLAAGLAVAAFVAWLSSLTSLSFTATQYAIFSSTMTLFPKLLGGYSGTMVDAFGYVNFFLFTALLGLPVIALIGFVSKRF